MLFYFLWNGAETFLLVQGAHSQKKLLRAVNLPLLFSSLLLPCSCAGVHLLPKASANMRKGTYNYKQVSELTQALTASRSAFSPYLRQPIITGKKRGLSLKSLLMQSWRKAFTFLLSLVPLWLVVQWHICATAVVISAPACTVAEADKLSAFRTSEREDC